MLETFRKYSQHVVFKILFGLLVLAFVLSGVTGLSHLSFSEKYLVKVGDEKITQEAVDAKYEQTVRNIRRSGLDFNEEQLAAFGISKPQILRTMVQDSLVRQEVADLGLEAGDEAVAEQIKSIPEFQTDGKFDREKFTYAITGLGLNEAQFTKMLRNEIKSNLLMQTVLTNIPVNDYVTKRAAGFYGETRDIEIAEIPKGFKGEAVEPTEKDLKDYYFEHSYEFQIPETRDISFVTLKKDKANEAALYDMTVKMEDEIAGGATLKEIADKLKLDLKKKQALTNDDDSLSELFVETTFSKNEGEISDLVYDEKNSEYFVVEVNKVTKSRIPDLAEVRAEVVAAWKEDKANDQNLEYIKMLADELKESKEPLKSFAAENGFKYIVLKDVSREDTDKYGARLVNDAFSAQKGAVLGSFQNSDGTYKLATLKDIKQVKLTEADEAKYQAQVADALKVEIVDQYFDYLRKQHPLKQKAQPAPPELPKKAEIDKANGGDEVKLPAKK